MQTSLLQHRRRNHKTLALYSFIFLDSAHREGSKRAAELKAALGDGVERCAALRFSAVESDWTAGELRSPLVAEGRAPRWWEPCNGGAR